MAVSFPIHAESSAGAGGPFIYRVTGLIAKRKNVTGVRLSSDGIGGSPSSKSNEWLVPRRREVWLGSSQRGMAERCLGRNGREACDQEGGSSTVNGGWREARGRGSDTHGAGRPAVGWLGGRDGALLHAHEGLRYTYFSLRYAYLSLRHGYARLRHTHFSSRYTHAPLRHSDFSLRPGHLSLRHGRAGLRHTDFSLRHSHLSLRHAHLSLRHANRASGQVDGGGGEAGLPSGDLTRGLGRRSASGDGARFSTVSFRGPPPGSMSGARRRGLRRRRTVWPLLTPDKVSLVGGLVSHPSI